MSAAMVAISVGDEREPDVGVSQAGAEGAGTYATGEPDAGAATGPSAAVPAGSRVGPVRAPLSATNSPVRASSASERTASMNRITT